MSITGTNLKDLVYIASKSDTDMLKAVKAAVSQSWPNIRVNEYASAGTLAASTYEYSLSALTTLDPLFGVGEVLIDESTSGAPVRRHGVKQYYDHSATAWTLVFDASLVSTYLGKTFYVRYQYPHALPSALTDTLYLPTSYLIPACTHWLAMYYASQENVDRSGFERIADRSEREYVAALRANQTPALTPLPTAVLDRMY